ncbi:hypothetical protein FJTKL_13939 [Diaporthe vaccinii]|uniref:Dioxygenase n=1 Tax=Diaporthe vaccinii TaxID=105482 RepID=A0ABR4F9Y4_9PEZI
MGSESEAIPPSMMDHLPRRGFTETVVSRPASSIEEKMKELAVSEFFHFEDKDPSRKLLPNQPTRFDAELASCVARGAVPTSIDGTYYRIVIEPIFANRNKQDIWINGDGSVHAWRFSNGVVDFSTKFVGTPRFIIERTARQPLWGTYRNPYAGDTRVFDEVQSTGNTHVQFWRGKLLVMKEDSPPLILDPDTLDTFGFYDFEGQVTAKTFTAHPKTDFTTGEMAAYSMEASGLGLIKREKSSTSAGSRPQLLPGLMRWQSRTIMLFLS